MSEKDTIEFHVAQAWVKAIVNLFCAGIPDCTTCPLAEICDREKVG